MTLLGWDTSPIPRLDLWVLGFHTSSHSTFFIVVVEFLLCITFQRGNFSHRVCRIDEAPHVFKGYSLSLTPQMSITTAERITANYGLMPGCLTLETDVGSPGFKMQVKRQLPSYPIRFSFGNISHAERCDLLKGVNERAFPREG